MRYFGELTHIWLPLAGVENGWDNDREASSLNLQWALIKEGEHSHSIFVGVRAKEAISRYPQYVGPCDFQKFNKKWRNIQFEWEQQFF